MTLAHADGRVGPFLAGDHVIAEGVRCHGLVIAVHDEVPTVMWTRSNGHVFICSDDTFRLQELVDKDFAVICNEEFYISDTIILSKSITIDGCKITMIGNRDLTILHLAAGCQLMVIQNNYLNQIYD